MKIRQATKKDFNELFAIISPPMMVLATNNDIESKIIAHIQSVADPCISYDVVQSVETILIQFLSLGLIKNEIINNINYWKLTPLGHEHMLKLRAIKKQK